MRVRIATVLAVVAGGLVCCGLRSAAEDGFRFPDDRGGKLLAELLPPRENLPRLPYEPAGDGRAPRPAAELEAPDLPLPAVQPTLPRPALPYTQRSPSPRPLPEAPPLAGLGHDPAPPAHRELPTGPRARLAGRDVNEPLPLPPLGLPQPESNFAEDPTADASLAAALKATPPERMRPVPFVRQTVPEPYEHRQSAGRRARVPDEEFP
jgi:hypothetical protein